MDYDLIIIGSGSAGTSAAEAAKDFGLKKIAIVEGRARLGGECPNRACMPSKAYLRAVEVLELARRASEFGLQIPKIKADFRAIMAKKEEAVDALTKPPRLENYFKSLSIDLIRGWAKFVDSQTIEVRERKYTARRFIIAAGSETFIPPIPGLREIGYLTSDDFMELREQPSSILILGGGPVGVETAHFLAAMGTKVMIVQSAPQILNREDFEIAAIVANSFKKRGIEIFTNTTVKKAAKTKKGIALTIGKAGSRNEQVLNGDSLLVAAGKKPALGQLNLDKLGLKIDQRGAPITNEYLQTSLPHIYLAGDVSDHLLFTHTAHYEGEIAARNASVNSPSSSLNLRRKKGIIPIDLRVVPRGTFCRPEVGSVGLTEKEAREKGFSVGVGRAPYSALGKSLVAREMDGLIKIVADKKTKLVLGGHIVGEAAAEIVHEIALAMAGNLPYPVIAKMIHAFPTFAEGVGAAAFEIK